MMNANPNITPEQKEKYFTIKQAADSVKLDYSSIRKACIDGQLQHSVVPKSRGNGDMILISETALTEWYVNRKERVKSKPPSASIKEMTVEDLANEILKRMRGSYEAGYKQGRKDARAEFMSAFNGIK